MTHHRRARARKLGDWVVNSLILVFALAPIAWGLSTSLKRTEKILELPPEIIPSEPTLTHYIRLFFEGGISRYIANSLLVSAATVALCLSIGALGGYALARFQFRGKGLVMLIVVSVMSIPIASMIVPTYTLMAQLGLLNSRLGLVLIYTAYQLPMVVWLLYGYFQTIPRELENAAMIDGYSRLAAMRKVLLPLSGPGLVAAGLFVLVFAWNDFVVALVMTSEDAVRTLPVAIYFYLGFYGREWGPLTASAMISIVPVIGIFVVFQRYFMSGMTGGGVKG